jgi:hypothetical protein
MNKAPAFQFYPADWRKDPGIQALSRHDQSVWFDLLCIMHESDERGVLLLAGKPIPEDAIARMLNLDNQTCNQTLTTLLTYGVASRRESDGAIYSRRMVKDEALIQIRRNAGKMGGNPLLVKQKPTSPVKQKPTPSSSSSSSSSKGTCTLDEAKAFAVECGLPASDGESCFHKWEGNGWMNGTNRVKDWKATIRSWQAAGYMPSQKGKPSGINGQRQPRNPAYNVATATTGQTPDEILKF